MRIGLALLPPMCAALGQQAESPTFDSLLQKFTSAAADFCSGDRWQDLNDAEFRLFERAEKEVAQALNGELGAREATPRARAAAVLHRLEDSSSSINRSWPEDSRFHFEMLDLPPALLVRMTFRNRAAFAFFALFPDQVDRNRGDRWQTLGAIDDHIVKGSGASDFVDLFPLDRGPSKRPRFLAKFTTAGCAGPLGVGYYAYEYHDEGVAYLDEVIKLEGALQLDPPAASERANTDPDTAFFPVGELQTKGPMVSLPYCWFSAIDTWDNPSLCAVNSYDISGDAVRFAGSVVNRPDLLPITKAIEHAEARDYPAVLAYAGSPDVAQRMVSEIPAFVTGVVVFSVERVDALHKRVELNDDPTFRFDIEKRGDRWIIVGFRTE